MGDNDLGVYRALVRLVDQVERVANAVNAVEEQARWTARGVSDIARELKAFNARAEAAEARAAALAAQAVEVEPDIHALGHYAVCAVLQNGSGQVLGVTRRGSPEDWGLPGGKVEPGESAVTAVIRECAEETGVVIHPSNVEYLFARPSDRSSKLVICFRIKEWGGEPRQMEAGIDVRWLSSYERLCGEACTYRQYNRELGAFLVCSKGWVI